MATEHTPGVYYNTFVFEYGSEAAARADVQKVFVDRPFMHDGPIETRTVCVSMGDQIAVKDALLEALQGLVRYAEAVRHTAGMGKSQLERLEKAKAALKLAGGQQ
jgi:hypothetical protein